MSRIQRIARSAAAATPQTEKLFDDQVMNNAGGYVFKIDSAKRVARYLILGADGGTYYVSEKKLHRDNILCIDSMLDENRGLELVELIKTISTEGRSAKQDQVVFALSYTAHRTTDADVRTAAYAALKEVCRTPTMLFGFVAAAEAVATGTGWGRAQRRAISEWYAGRPAKKLAYLVTKYRKREGWTHRDVLRLAHPKTDSRVHNLVIKYCLKDGEALTEPSISELLAGKGDNLPAMTDEQKVEFNEVLEYLLAVEQLRAMENVEQVAEAMALVAQYRFAWEHVPTGMLKSPDMWTTLLQDMGITAMLRNLGRMSTNGVFENPAMRQLVTSRLVDYNVLHQGRVHPLSVLIALKTYESGRGHLGSLTWHVYPDVVEALDQAFYTAFKVVEPSHKRFLLALDVSGSMGSAMCTGCPVLTARDGSAAMAMTTLRTEPECKVVAFGNTMHPIDLKPSDSLKQVLGKISGLPFGSTDCGLPMIHAAKQGWNIDTFIVYTDNETYAGPVQPVIALQQYRDKMKKPDAQLIVVGMTSTEFSIADSKDPNMLDVVGFDSSAPAIIRAFAAGEI